MAELVDARDLKSLDLYGRGGSSPLAGTNKTNKNNDLEGREERHEKNKRGRGLQ